MLMGRCRVHVDGGGVGFILMGSCRVHVDGEV